jgi:hypothetical protein
MFFHPIECMEYRLLGNSGLKVSTLSFGAGTFGGTTEFFKAWGETNVEEAKRMVELPTSTRRALRKRFWARRLRASATNC